MNEWKRQSLEVEKSQTKLNKIVKLFHYFDPFFVNT